jgi:hypothetical protein
VLHFACTGLPSLQAVLIANEIAGQQGVQRERERERSVKVMFALSSNWPRWLDNGTKCLVRSLAPRLDDRSIPGAVGQSKIKVKKKRISSKEPRIFLRYSFQWMCFLPFQCLFIIYFYRILFPTPLKLFHLFIFMFLDFKFYTSPVKIFTNFGHGVTQTIDLSDFLPQDCVK